jgi:hypothetical protein
MFKVSMHLSFHFQDGAVISNFIQPMKNSANTTCYSNSNQLRKIQDLSLRDNSSRNELASITSWDQLATFTK